jgi:hypothetical protein
MKVGERECNSVYLEKKWLKRWKSTKPSMTNCSIVNSIVNVGREVTRNVRVVTSTKSGK